MHCVVLFVLLPINVKQLKKLIKFLKKLFG